MDRDNYKYDIALSFAEEDRNIAVALARELGHKAVGVYYYPDNIAETTGKNIPQKLAEIYRKEAKYAVVIVSDKYFKKKYATIEFEAIKVRAAESPDSIYMIPLLAGDITLLGEHALEEVGALKWEYNPERIAEVLCTLLGTTKQNFWRNGNYNTLLSKNDVIINQIGKAVIIYQNKNKLLYWTMIATFTILVCSLIWYKARNNDPDSVSNRFITDTGKIAAASPSLQPPLVNFYQLRVSKDTITSIELQQNDTLRITADGIISPALLADNCGPDGISDNEQVVDKIIKRLICPFPQWNYAALIYRLDTSYGWKFCGSTASFDIAKEYSLLEFKINETNQDDNTGGYDVDVTIWRAKAK